MKGEIRRIMVNVDCMNDDECRLVLGRMVHSISLATVLRLLAEVCRTEAESIQQSNDHATNNAIRSIPWEDAAERMIAASIDIDV